MRAANLAARFVFELAALAGIAYWGAGATSSAVANILIAILAPFAVATVWAIWSAPTASRRLSGRQLITLELVLLGLACALIATAGAPLFAALLALLALANGAPCGASTARGRTPRRCRRRSRRGRARRRKGLPGIQTRPQRWPSRDGKSRKVRPPAMCHQGGWAHRESDCRTGMDGEPPGASKREKETPVSLARIRTDWETAVPNG